MAPDLLLWTANPVRSFNSASGKHKKLDLSERNCNQIRTTARGKFAPITTLASEWPESDRHATVALGSLYFSLFGHFQRIIDLDAQISNRAFKLGVPK